MGIRKDGAMKTALIFMVLCIMGVSVFGVEISDIQVKKDSIHAKVDGKNTCIVRLVVSASRITPPKYSMLIHGIGKMNHFYLKNLTPLISVVVNLCGFDGDGNKRLIYGPKAIPLDAGGTYYLGSNVTAAPTMEIVGLVDIFFADRDSTSSSNKSQERQDHSQLVEKKEDKKKRMPIGGQYPSAEFRGRFLNPATRPATSSPIPQLLIKR